MQKEILISIIVPVYNADKYLNRCIQSILNQTYKSFELILVDDGSNDKSGEICDSFATSDKRIKVIHQKNSGVSVARNAGISLAKGKFLSFVDSDDWIREDYLEILLRSSFNNNVELVVGSLEYRGIKCFKTDLPNKIINFECTDENDINVLFKTADFRGPTAKLFLTDIIKDNNILFSTGVAYAEDTIFLHNYLKFCKKIATIKDAICFYNRFNINSATHKIFKEITDWLPLYMTNAIDFLNVLKIEEKIRNRVISEFAFEKVMFIFHNWINSKDKVTALSKIQEGVNILHEYLFADTFWNEINDDLSEFRKSLYNNDINSAYIYYKKKFKNNIFKKYLLNIYFKINKFLFEKKRDNLK